MFKHYLEMLTTKEFRQKMSDAGLQANVRQDKQALPEWFIHDILLFHIISLGMEGGVPMPENPTSDLKHLIVNKARSWVYPSMEAMVSGPEYESRFIITRDGQFIGGDGADWVHGQLILFGMCNGQIPMIEELKNGGWNNNLNSLQYFMCFEYIPKKDKFDRAKERDGTLGVNISDSYNKEMQAAFWEAGMKMSVYKNAVNKINGLSK